MNPVRLLLAAFLIVGCPGDPGPARSGSASATLADRTRKLGERAHDVAARASDLTGQFDTIRATPGGDHAATLTAVRSEAAALAELAREIESEAQAIGASAQVY